MIPLKIAVVIPTYPNIKSSLQNLLKVYECLMRRHNVRVTLFIDEKYDFKYPGFLVEKVKGLDHGTIVEKVLLLLGLQRDYYIDLEEKLKGYDIIETSNPEFYWFAYQSFLAAKANGSKLVYRTSQTVDGFYLFPLTKWIPILISRKAYAFASSLLFTNPQALERCERLGLLEKGSKKSVIIGHATDTRMFAPLGKSAKKNTRRILLSVGGLYKIKGHHLIIEALKKIVDGGKDAELWIVGDGYFGKELLLKAKKMGLQDRVKLLGSKNHKELKSIYCKADVFVLANYQEITPAVNEALACQKPVVVMECGGRPFVIPDESYGLVCKRFDVNEMARKVVALLDNPSLAKKVAMKGRKRVVENFSIEAVAEKFYRAFR